MSFFDPHYLYHHPQRQSHKGQIIQKKAVKTSYALTDEDLKKAVEACLAYGYYVSPQPPQVPTLHSLITNFTYSINPQRQSYSFPWSSLNSTIFSTYIMQNAPSGSAFNLSIYLTSLSVKVQKGSTANTLAVNFGQSQVSRSLSYSSFIEITPYNSNNYQIVYGDQNQTFNYNSNVSTGPYSEESQNELNFIARTDIDQFREDNI